MVITVGEEVTGFGLLAMSCAEIAEVASGGVHFVKTHHQTVP